MFYLKSISIIIYMKCVLNGSSNIFTLFSIKILTWTSIFNRFHFVFIKINNIHQDVLRRYSQHLTRSHKSDGLFCQNYAFNFFTSLCNICQGHGEGEKLIWIYLGKLLFNRFIDLAIVAIFTLSKQTKLI